MNTATYCSLFEVIAWQMFQSEEAVNFAKNLACPSETHMLVWQCANKKRKKPCMSFERAYTNIVNSLQLGKLTAYGRRNDCSRSQEISVGEWRDMTLSNVRAYPNTAYTMKHGRPHIEFIEVCFLRSEAEALFHSGKKKSKNEDQKEPNAIATMAHRDWAKSYYNKLKGDGLRSTRQEDEKAFRERFLVSPRRIIRDLRKEYMPEWCGAGRRASKYRK